MLARPSARPQPVRSPPAHCPWVCPRYFFLKSGIGFAGCFTSLIVGYALFELWRALCASFGSRWRFGMAEHAYMVSIAVSAAGGSIAFGFTGPILALTKGFVDNAHVPAPAAFVDLHWSQLLLFCVRPDLPLRIQCTSPNAVVLSRRSSSWTAFKPPVFLPRGAISFFLLFDVLQQSAAKRSAVSHAAYIVRAGRDLQLRHLHRRRPPP